MKPLVFACLAFLIVVGMPLASATVIPSFVAVSAIAASTGADVTITLPATWEPGDVFLVIGVVKDQDDSVTMTGYTAMTGSPFNRNTVSRYWLFWKRATTSESNPLFDKSTATGATTALMAVYRNAKTTGNTFDVIGAAATGTTDPASCTAITTIAEYVLIIAALAGENTNNAAITTTATNPRNAWVEHYTESATSVGMATFSEFQKTETGTTGAVSVNFDVANPTGWGCMVLSLGGPSSVAGQATHNSLVKITAEAPGGNCANGGQKIESGIDNGDGGGVADDGILQAGEVDSTAYVCNGAPGAPGTNGANGFNSLTLLDTTVGTNCDAYAGTGQRIRWGLDNGDGGGTANDGILQSGEVDGTAYVCNGAAGATGTTGATGPTGPEGPHGTNGTDATTGPTTPTVISLKCAYAWLENRIRCTATEYIETEFVASRTWFMDGKEVATNGQILNEPLGTLRGEVRVRYVIQTTGGDDISKTEVVRTDTWLWPVYASVAVLLVVIVRVKYRGRPPKGEE